MDVIYKIMPNILRLLLGLSCLLFGAWLSDYCDRAFDGHWSIRWICLWTIGIGSFPIAFILLILPVGWDWWL